MANRVKVHRKADLVNSPRPYRSSLRTEQARETRLKILESARGLFVNQGYAATSIDAIAHEAGVATQTVYSAFSNKRTILARVLDLAVGGDDQNVPLLERIDPQAMRNEPDQCRQLELMAHGITHILSRAGPVFLVIQAAAHIEPEIAALSGNIQNERLQNMGRIVGWIVAHGPLKPGLTETEAADLLWTLTSADLWRLLVCERRWSATQYQRWLSDALISNLLP